MAGVVIREVEIGSTFITNSQERKKQYWWTAISWGIKIAKSAFLASQQLYIKGGKL
jgi:hypothetical protein